MAREKQVDGIKSFGVDPGVVTASYVTNTAGSKGVTRVDDNEHLKEAVEYAFEKSYHHFLTKSLDTFHGMSTKYLTWNNDIVHNKAGFRQKVDGLLDAIADTFFSETYLAVPKRQPISILVKIS